MTSLPTTVQPNQAPIREPEQELLDIVEHARRIFGECTLGLRIEGAIGVLRIPAHPEYRTPVSPRIVAATRTPKPTSRRRARR